MRHAADLAAFQQLIESRDAQFGALAGVAFAEGLVVREPVLRPTLFEGTTMNIGIVCYASVGGSGVVATELGKALATAATRCTSSAAISRSGSRRSTGSCSTRSSTPTYPLFREPQYLLSLANTIVQVAREQRLDIIHAHYAIPHATAAYLARQILAARPAVAPPRSSRRFTARTSRSSAATRRIAQIVAFSIDQSTASPPCRESLRDDTMPRAVASARRSR